MSLLFPKIDHFSFSTKIDLPESGSDSDMITITGKKADVEKARDEIQKIQAEKANVVSIEVKIPANIHNTIIGAGGKIIQSIMDDCGGVHIKFPEAKSGSDKVTLDIILRLLKTIYVMINTSYPCLTW